MKLTDIQAYWNEYASNIIYDAYQESLLYEGLIYSYEPDVVVQKIHKMFPNKKIKPKIMPFAIIRVEFHYPFDKQDFDKLMSFVSLAGWFFVGSTIINRNNSGDRINEKDYNILISQLEKLPPKTLINVVLEPKYGYEVHEIYKQVKTLYHITPKKYTNKILSIGLTPKTKSKLGNHPERIYLATSLHDVGYGLLPHMKTITNEKDWTILQIDASFFKTPGVRAFTDPMFPSGIFTLSNIPPHYITTLKQIKG